MHSSIHHFHRIRKKVHCSVNFQYNFLKNASKYKGNLSLLLIWIIENVYTYYILVQVIDAVYTFSLYTFPVGPCRGGMIWYIIVQLCNWPIWHHSLTIKSTPKHFPISCISFFVLGGGLPLYPEIFTVCITKWTCSAPGPLREMPDSNPGPLPQKSCALPLTHHISKCRLISFEPPHLFEPPHIIEPPHHIKSTTSHWATTPYWATTPHWATTSY